VAGVARRALLPSPPCLQVGGGGDVVWQGWHSDALSQTPPRVCEREGVVTYTPTFASEMG
jgi:hypothetical protein